MPSKFWLSAKTLGPPFKPVTVIVSKTFDLIENSICSVKQNRIFHFWDRKDKRERDVRETLHE